MLLTLESRVASLEKGLDALPVVIGLKRRVRLLSLIPGKRALIRQPPHELLVPSVHEWRACGDATSGGPRFLLDFPIRDNSIHETLLVCLFRIEEGTDPFACETGHRRVTLRLPRLDASRGSMSNLISRRRELA